MNDRIEDILDEDAGTVSATQPSMVDGGKVDVFGSNGSKFSVKDEEDFINQLLQLEDYNE